MTRATEALIDLSALISNFERVRQFAPSSKIMPVIKANGYGYGIVPIAKALDKAAAFAVAIIDEAVVLREAGVQQPITVLQGVFYLEELRLAEELGLDLVVHQPEQIALLQQASLAKPISIWLKVDTGMHRLGINANQLDAAWQVLQASVNVSTVRLMSHFACADDTENPMTQQQFDRFQQLAPENPVQRSLANSAAIMAWPQTHREWVRPGIMLYGISPMLDWRSREDGLTPVMTLRSSVIAINEVKPGESVGYGAHWVANGPRRVAVVAIGYGDGYPRILPDGTPVLVRNHRAKLIGRVSMDSIVLDITDFPDIQLGDVATLWGPGLPVEEIAEYAKTIAYELVCQLSLRIPRHYV